MFRKTMEEILALSPEEYDAYMAEESAKLDEFRIASGRKFTIEETRSTFEIRMKEQLPFIYINGDPVYGTDCFTVEECKEWMKAIYRLSVEDLETVVLNFEGRGPVLEKVSSKKIWDAPVLTDEQKKHMSEDVKKILNRLRTYS